MEPMENHLVQVHTLVRDESRNLLIFLQSSHSPLLRHNTRTLITAKLPHPFGLKLRGFSLREYKTGLDGAASFSIDGGHKFSRYSPSGIFVGT